MDIRKISQTTVDFNFSDSRDQRTSNSDRSKLTYFENFLSGENQYLPQEAPQFVIKSENNGIKTQISPLKHNNEEFESFRNSNLKMKRFSQKYDELGNFGKIQKYENYEENKENYFVKETSKNIIIKENGGKFIKAKLDNSYKRSFCLKAVSNVQKTNEKRQNKLLFETSKSSIKHMNTTNSASDDVELLHSLAYDSKTTQIFKSNFASKDKIIPLDGLKKPPNYDSESDFQSCNKLKPFFSRYEGSTQIQSVTTNMEDVHYINNLKENDFFKKNNKNFEKNDSENMIEFYQYRSKKDLFGTQSRSKYLETEDINEKDYSTFRGEKRGMEGKCDVLEKVVRENENLEYENVLFYI